MRDFSKIGFVTWGDPNHYDSDKPMQAELRRRIKDGDEGGKACQDLLDSEGLKPKDLSADHIGDLLSDTCPNGYLFEVRKGPDGNHNWGYFPID